MNDNVVVSSQLCDNLRIEPILVCDLIFSFVKRQEK